MLTSRNLSLERLRQVHEVLSADAEFRERYPWKCYPDDPATREASASFQSEGKFPAAPAETVKFLAEKVKLAEPLRLIRAVMILELIGDRDSKELLRKWADGPMGALLTVEASAALKRLETASKANR